MTAVNKEKVLDSFIDKMKKEGVPGEAIDNFCYYYRKLIEGENGEIPEEEIEPVMDLESADDIPRSCREVGKKELSKTVHMVLNGGLGTGMGMKKAKSLLSVRASMSFLDIIAKRSFMQGTALVLMNSFATRTDSLRAVEKYYPADYRLKKDFLQHKTPKVKVAGLRPAVFEKNPALEWCPPGHGDIYPALSSSRMLDELIEGGYRHAFVSNADNLGAVVDESILGFFVESKAPFMMEVAERTAADSKGGHIARFRSDGKLVLREAAQCPQKNVGEFSDIGLHQYFNTNNLWLDLSVLKDVLKRKKNILGLPMILNRKTVDPLDPASFPVYQLETAMGAAIQVFEGAEALLVPRERFLPVKSTNDLFVMRSDAVEFTPDLRIVRSPRLDRLPLIDLDPRYYRNIEWFEERFAQGVPSLVCCESLSVEGDVFFGSGIKVKGRVVLKHGSPSVCGSGGGSSSRSFVPDGTVLQDFMTVRD